MSHDIRSISHYALVRVLPVLCVALIAAGSHTGAADALNRDFTANTRITSNLELPGAPGGAFTTWNIPAGVIVTLDSPQGGQLLTAMRRGGPEQLGPAFFTLTGGGVLYSRKAKEFGIRLGHAIGNDGSYYGGSCTLTIADGTTARFDTEIAVFPTGGYINLEGKGSALEFLESVPCKINEATGELIVRKLYGSTGRIPLCVNGAPLRTKAPEQNADFEVVRVEGTIYRRLRSRAASPNALKLKQSVFYGWKDAREIRRGAISLTVVPQTGKLMALSLADGKNLLWVNQELAGKTLVEAASREPLFGWANFGGDRFWVIPQADNAQVRGGKTWPADETFDGKPWRCTNQPAEGVILESGLSPESGVRAKRRIIMPDYPGLILFDQEIKAEAGRLRHPLNLIQNVTVVNRPDLVIARLPRQSHFRAGKYLPEGVSPQTFPKEEQTAKFLEAQNGFVFLKYPEQGFTGKFYADIRDGWICAVYGTKVFFQCFRYQPEAYYSDGGCSAEAYVSNYCELELLSPARMLRSTETLRFKTAWYLADLSIAGDSRLAIALKCERKILEVMNSVPVRNFFNDTSSPQTQQPEVFPQDVRPAD